MSRYVAPILIYLALFGLIFTTGIATFGRIQDTINSQLSRATGSASTPQLHSPASVNLAAVEDLYQEIYKAEKQGGLELAEFSEESLGTEAAPSSEQTPVNNHLTSLKRLGRHISVKISGQEP